MANKKITELPVATTPGGTELAEIVQGGVNKQVTLQEIADLGAGGGGTVPDASETVKGIIEIATQAETHTGTDDVRALTPLKLAAEKGATGGIVGMSGFSIAFKNLANTFTSLFQNAATAARTYTFQNRDGTIADDTDLALKLAITAFAPYVIDQATPSTAGGTITLDMNSQIQRSFVGSATFAAAKIIALSNTTNSLFFNFIFEITNIAAVLTMPSDFAMADANWDGTNWTPAQTGKYEIGGSFDDVNNIWYVKISGAFIQ